MRAITLLALPLALALVKADGEFIIPGVRTQQMRPKRQESVIVFPDVSIDFTSFFGNDGFAPVQPQPSLPMRTPDEGTDAPLELPDDLDLNGMDRNSLALVNNIDNITAFADLFGITLPANDEPIFAGSLHSGPLSRSSIVTGPSQIATMATCKPEIRTVELDLPVEPNTLFYPTCVRLEQCGGCCYGPLLTCRPKLTKVVNLKVLKTVISTSSSSSISSSRRRTVRGSTNGGRRQGRRGRRRRRQSIPSYHEVEAIKHVQCECGCKVQEQDCNPAIHHYMEGECSCVCKRRDEKLKCERQRNTKYWDSDSCACYCKRNVDCTTGEIFSQDSCRCERPATRRGFPIERGDHIERRRPFERPHRRRPHRIPLRPDAEPSSSRNERFGHIMNSPGFRRSSRNH